MIQFDPKVIVALLTIFSMSFGGIWWGASEVGAVRSQLALINYRLTALEAKKTAIAP